MISVNSNVFVVLEELLPINITIYAKNISTLQAALLPKSIGNTHSDTVKVLPILAILVLQH